MLIFGGTLKLSSSQCEVISAADEISVILKMKALIDVLNTRIHLC